MSVTRHRWRASCFGFCYYCLRETCWSSAPSWLSSCRSAVETGLTLCRRRDEKPGIFSLQMFLSLQPCCLEQDVSFVSLPLQHIKNSADTNKFDGWPDVLEMEGCVPQRTVWWSGQEILCTLFPQSVRQLPAPTSCIGQSVWLANTFEQLIISRKKKKNNTPPPPNSQCSAACSVGTASMQMRGKRRRRELMNRCPFCSFRSVPRRSCNTELIGRLHWCEDKGLVIYPRAVTTVMVLSYCTAVHEWLNLWRLVCCVRVHVCEGFFLFFTLTFLHCSP